MPKSSDMKHIYCLILPLFLCSCASISTTGRTFSYVEKPSTDQSFIYIYAPDTGCADFGQMSAEIFMDNDSKLNIDEGYYALLKLDPSNYEFHASTDDQMACGGQLFPGRRFDPVQIQSRSGEIHYMRYSSHPVESRCVSTCFRSLKLIEESVALKELKNLKEVITR